MPATSPGRIGEPPFSIRQIGGFAAAALSPNHRRWLSDARVAGMSDRTVAYHAAVRVPLGTVVWEETAFRANSVLFGLWHVRPTLDALRLNGVPSGGLPGWAAVVSAVVAAALADVLLSGLQRPTGSLLAPALVHVATNSGGTVAAAVAGRCRVPWPR